MGVKIMARFNRNGKKLEKGEKARVSIGVHWSSSRRKFLPTDYFIAEDQWDSKTRLVNKKHPNQKYINAKLTEIISKLETFEFSLQSNNQELTQDLLEDFARRNFDNFNNVSLNYFLEQQVNNWKFNTLSTYQHHKKTLNKFNEFKKDVMFHEITVFLVEQFDDFMKQQGLKINSRGNHHKNLKANLHIAATEGYIEPSKIPYATQIGGTAGKFKVKKGDGSIINLDFEEKERIEQLCYPDKPHLDRYRKMFLFMCYTGLRISDVEYLQAKHLHCSSKGYQVDLKKMIKTRKPVFLELYELFEGKPETILKEFLTESFGTTDYDEIKKEKKEKFVFSHLTGQVLNRELKIIAEDARIYKNLFAHVGRHTFGTHMAVLTNGNVSLIRDLLGHSKTDTTMVYIRLAEKMRGQQLKKVDWNAHKEVNENTTEAEEQKIVKSKKKQAPDVNKAKGLNTATHGPENQKQFLQIKNYILKKVLPVLDLPTRGEVRFSISDDSIKNYVELLPFKPEDYANYQKNPIELQGFIQDVDFLAKIENIQNIFNNHIWVKGACLKLSISFMPVLDDANSTFI